MFRVQAVHSCVEDIVGSRKRKTRFVAEKVVVLGISAAVVLETSRRVTVEEASASGSSPVQIQRFFCEVSFVVSISTFPAASEFDALGISVTQYFPLSSLEQIACLIGESM